MPRLVKADYAWIPKYDNLFIRLGGEFYRTGSNFLQGGAQQSLTLSGELVQLKEYQFFVEPEFGFVKDWSAYLHLNYQQSSIDSSVYSEPSFMLGSGLGDIYAGLKWNVNASPTITFEARFKIPTYSYYALSVTDLVQGDGDFSVEGRVHAGYRFSNFFFSLAPGIIGRFAGYSPAFTFLGAAGFTFSPAYLVAIAEGYYSFVDVLFLDSSLAIHDAAGTGGSYARLSGSPSYFDIGLKAGMCFTQNYFLEAQVKQALFGKRAANFIDFSINFFAKFDFFKPEQKPRIKEIPLDSPPDTYWDGQSAD